MNKQRKYHLLKARRNIVLFVLFWSLTVKELIKEAFIGAVFALTGRSKGAQNRAPFGFFLLAFSIFLKQCFSCIWYLLPWRRDRITQIHVILYYRTKWINLLKMLWKSLDEYKVIVLETCQILNISLKTQIRGIFIWVNGCWLLFKMFP